MQLSTSSDNALQVESIHAVRGAYEVSEHVYNKVAYRGGTEGVIAEVKTPSRSLSDLRLSKHPLIVVLESVEKPGNLGSAAQC